MPRNYQKKIVYLTEAQYQDLISDGQLVVDGQTIVFSENDLYVTPQETPLYPAQLGEGLALNDGEIEVVGKLDSSLKGSPSGLAELDSGGKVPSSQLPSYVDDVVEYNSTSNFPNSGETGKIYVAKDTNLTYRWSGSGYVEISQSLALGETEATAYRGDRGKTAYDHAAAKGSAFSSGLYKITTNAQGHVTAATAVQKADIVGLGIVDDVQVNGTSVVANDVANIPVASSSTLGVVKVAASNGVDMSQNNNLLISTASATAIKNGTNQYNPITPSNQNTSVFYGLAKAAGDSTQAASNNAVGTYTSDAKSAIQTMLDVPSNSALTTAITNLSIDDYVKQESDHEANESYGFIYNRDDGIDIGFYDATTDATTSSIVMDSLGGFSIYADSAAYISGNSGVNISGDVYFESNHVGQENWSPTYDSDFTTKGYVDGEIAGVTTSSIGAMSTSHAANNITASDISNWNAKVSDDKTWNGVSLTKSSTTINGTSYVPAATSASPSTMNMTEYTATPGANKIAKYDSSSYLHSTTPTAGDDSTKAATTAFVGAAIGAITPASIGAMATSHAANGISSSDISNWNAKVSDDKTWNSVDLTKSAANFTGATNYVPAVSATDSTGANYMKATRSPTAHALAKYDSSSYLYSTTPGSTDNSTKVATTSFVATAIDAITAADVGATTSSDVNGQITAALAALTAADVGAMSTSHAANGISASDISNWNAKVSDDKTWNSVSLTKSSSNFTGETNYVTAVTGTSATGANYMPATRAPQAHALAKYDTNSYLYSTTPGSTDNTTKVATTAFVKTAVGAVTPASIGATTTSDVNSLIASAIGNINSFDTAIVQTLPTTNISTHTIYFIANTGSTPNSYDEYLYINNNWEKIGTTDVDLSGYVTTTHDFTGNIGSAGISYFDGDSVAGVGISFTPTVGDETGIAVTNQGVNFASNGHIGPYSGTGWTPTLNNDFTTKGYVDSAVANVDLSDIMLVPGTGSGSAKLKNYSYTSGGGSVSVTNTASGVGAVAIGKNAVASGDFSFAAGEGVVANQPGMVAIGTYNLQDVSTSPSIVQWQPNTYYGTMETDEYDTFVSYDNTIWVCTDAHTSTSVFDYTKWMTVHTNDIVFAIGNGNDFQRGNCFTVDGLGNICTSGNIFVQSWSDELISPRKSMVATLRDIEGVQSLIPEQCPDSDVNAMLTNMGLSTTAYFNLAAAGTAETDHAIVQGG